MADTILSIIGGAGGASVRGASHVARKKPNQDAVGWQQHLLWTYIAVADGHGSAPHYRSDRGSRLAVDTVIQLLRDATDDGALRGPDILAGRIADLAPALVAAWRKKVEADIAADPIPEAPGYASHLVYGSTCLGVAVGPGMTLLIQIGDGDIFVGTPSGDIEVPLPPDETQGEQTYSLCLPDADQHAKIKLFCAPSPLCAPDFVLAATDGLAKSFADEAAVRDVVRQYRNVARERGLAAVVSELEPWLAKCSQVGSGDDTSVALFVVETAARVRPAPVVPLPAAEVAPPPRQIAVLPIVAMALLGCAAGAYAAAIAGPGFLSFLPGVAKPAATPVVLPAKPGSPKPAPASDQPEPAKADETADPAKPGPPDHALPPGRPAPPHGPGARPAVPLPPLRPNQPSG